MDLRITLKFLKSEPSQITAVGLQPNTNAFEITDHDYSANNTVETILCVIVTKELEQILTFELFTPVRRVILNGTDLSFEVTGKKLTLKLRALQNNNDRTADMHMIIPFSGVDLRLEVARPNQRSGKYQRGEFPLAARVAATTVEFALLEAVQALEMDKTIGLGPCGPILLMGFDTNNPCGHTDWPPHIHMHMARPAYGAPVGHYYFDSDLRFTHNMLDLRKTNTTTKHIGHNKSCLHSAPDGSVLFNLMITNTGGLCLSSEQGKSVYIEPRRAGFDTGAIVNIDETMKHVNIRIEDEAGEIKVFRDDGVSIYTFDTDTGRYRGKLDRTDTVDSSLEQV